jgi:hypothetical protein
MVVRFRLFLLADVFPPTWAICVLQLLFTMKMTIVQRHKNTYRNRFRDQRQSCAIFRQNLFQIMMGNPLFSSVAQPLPPN